MTYSARELNKPFVSQPTNLHQAKMKNVCQWYPVALRCCMYKILNELPQSLYVFIPLILIPYHVSLAICDVLRQSETHWGASHEKFWVLSLLSNIKFSNLWCDFGKVVHSLCYVIYKLYIIYINVSAKGNAIKPVF